MQLNLKHIKNKIRFFLKKPSFFRDFAIFFSLGLALFAAISGLFLAWVYFTQQLDCH